MKIIDNAGHIVFFNVKMQGLQIFQTGPSLTAYCTLVSKGCSVQATNPLLNQA